MPFPFLSLTSPIPEGFQFEPSPNMSKLRRSAFCLYSADPGLADSLILPWADKIFGQQPPTSPSQADSAWLSFPAPCGSGIPWGIFVTSGLSLSPLSRLSQALSVPIWN